MNNNIPHCSSRQSNIELLRCFAMVCIIVYHMLCLTIVPLAPDVMLFKAMQIPLHIGVPLFFLISGYFGIRFSLRGLVRYISKVYLYFVPLAVIVAYFVDHESLREIFRLFFVFGHDKHWYVNCYLYLFLFAPVINRYLDGISLRQRIYLLFILFFMSVYVGGMIMGDRYLVEGKNLTNVLMFYVLGNTIRQYQEKWKRLPMYQFVIAAILLNASFVFAYYNFSSLTSRIWNYSFPYNSPLIILNSILVFIIFAKMSFTSKFVNWLSGGIFACYLWQCVPLLWKTFFAYPACKIFSGGANSPILFLLGASIYAFAIMLVIVSVDKALNPLWNKLISIAERYDKKWNVKDVR